MAGLGNQTILWNYGAALTGSLLAEMMADIIPPGVYSGLSGSNGASSVSLTPGSIFIKDSNFDTTKIVVRVGFATTFAAPIDLPNKKDLVVARFTYTNSSDNVASIVNISSSDTVELASHPYDVILGRAVFDDIIGTPTGFTWDNAAKANTPVSIFGRESDFWVSPGSSAFTVRVALGSYLTDGGMKSYAGVSNLSIPAAGNYLIILNREGPTVSAITVATPLPSNAVILAQVSRRSDPGVYSITEGDIFNTLSRFDFSRGKNADQWDGVDRPLNLGVAAAALPAALTTDVVTTLTKVGDSGFFGTSAAHTPSASSSWTITLVAGGPASANVRYLALSDTGDVEYFGRLNGASVVWTRVWDDSRYQLDTTAVLGTSDTKVPSQKAVKTYADAGDVFTLASAASGAATLYTPATGTVLGSTDDGHSPSIKAVATAIIAQHQTIIQTGAITPVADGQIWLQ